MLSRLTNRHGARFDAYAWLALSYVVPRPEPHDLDADIASVRAQTGSDWHGYWKFFVRDDAHLKIEKNVSVHARVGRGSQSGRES